MLRYVLSIIKKETPPLNIKVRPNCSEANCMTDSLYAKF